MNRYVIGIDVGGTSVKTGIFSSSDSLLDHWAIPTDAAHGGSRIVSNITASILENLQRLELTIDQIVGAGIGIPGFINHSKNEVFEAVNIGWKNTPVGDQLSQLLGIPVWIENDANLAALGEYRQTTGDKPGSLLFVTLGTGVGGAVIVNGEIITGASGTAGEIGHTVVDRDSTFRCNCGRYGCLDTIASTAGIARLVREAQDKYPDALFLAKDLLDPVESATVFRLAEEDNPIALEVIHFLCDSLGYALASASMIVNPAQIIIGGGLSHYGEFFLDKVRSRFSHYVLDRLADETTVRLAELGNRAGIVGAAAFARVRARQLREHEPLGS